jgi:hypothetical protein
MNRLTTYATAAAVFGESVREEVGERSDSDTCEPYAIGVI